MGEDSREGEKMQKFTHVELPTEEALQLKIG
jgi:hypothetical protein